MRVAVTGADGLLGRHARCLLRAQGHRDQVLLRRGDLDRPDALDAALSGVDAVWHFAGINRAPDAELEAGNRGLAEALDAALARVGSRAPVIYASSIRSADDTPYGRGKRQADELLGAGAARRGARYVSVVLPNVFGEGARPFYNTVVATFCHHLAAGTIPTLDPGGAVELLHAGAVTERFLTLQAGSEAGPVRLAGVRMTIPELWERLSALAASYARQVLPPFRDPLDRTLFNAYRYALFPDRLTHRFQVHSDERGDLIEVIRESGPGQFFVSSTHPGKVRGRHWHRYLVERFCVVQGDAVVRLRPVLGELVTEIALNARGPQALDIPTLHVHEVENVGKGELIMAFWSDKHYDPAASDHYPEAVIL